MRVSRHTVIIVSVITLFFLQTAAVFYFYTRVQNAQKTLYQESPAGQSNDAALVAAVAQLMNLPQNEQPMIATVGDREKSAIQQYFPKVKPGDKILVYLRAKKAVIYDPVQHRVLDVAFLDAETATRSAAAATKPTP